MGRAPLLGLLALSASTRAVASDEPPCAGGFCSRRAWSCSWGACTPAELARRRTPPRPSEFWGACAGLPARPRLLPPEAAADGCELVLSIPLPVHAVFDFSCPETWSESTYESTLYCVMPQTGLMTLVETAAAGSNTANSSNPSIALVVPAAQAHATEQLLDAASLRSALLLVLPPGRDCSASCVRLPHKDVRVAWFDIPEGYGELDPAGARAYRARALRAAGLPPPGQGGRPDVLALISRPAGGSRAFANEDELAAELARAAPGLQLRRYFGNESLADTAAIFGRAQVVVGFHGAGFKHIILCPRHTLVLELTLLLAPAAAASTTIWRSNEEVGRLHGHVVWQTHALDPAEALPGWPAPADLFGSGSTRGDYERATLVRVPSRDVLNLANVVRAHVRQACAVPGGGNDGRPSGACTWAVRRLGP